MPTLMYAAGVTPNKVGGVESFCQKLASRLHPLGWNVVFCGISEAPEDVKSILALPNLKFDKLEHQFGISALQALEFARLVLRYRPEIVVYGLGGVLRTLPIVAKLLGTKHVIYRDETSRTVLNVNKSNWIKRAVAHLIVAPVDRVIAVTEFVRNAAIAEGFAPESRISVIPNGIAVDVALANRAEKRAQWRRRLGISERATVIMQTGWMIPAKGFDKLLHSAREVVLQHPETVFVMVGSGDHLDEYRALGKSLGIGEHVKWTGAVQSPYNDGIYATADVYCQLSQWQEAFGFTLIEAMAYGLPIIATSVGGIPEIVRNGENGFLLQASDKTAVARVIISLLADCELRRKFGERSQEIVRQRFDLEMTAERYIAAFGIKNPSSTETRSKAEPASAVNF